MPVKIVKGDLIKSYTEKELTAYAHQCNCFCRMGRGIAPLLAKANPEVRFVDNATFSGDQSKLGTFTRTNSIPFIYNVYGQYHWNKYKVAHNRNTDYDALKSGLIAVRDDLIYSSCIDAPSLGIPLIGCGLAGGNWEDVVLPMILDIFEESCVEVTIFVLE